MARTPNRGPKQRTTRPSASSLGERVGGDLGGCRSGFSGWRRPLCPSDPCS